MSLVFAWPLGLVVGNFTPADSRGTHTVHWKQSKAHRLQRQEAYGHPCKLFSQAARKQHGNKEQVEPKPKHTRKPKTRSKKQFNQTGWGKRRCSPLSAQIRSQNGSLRRGLSQDSPLRLPGFDAACHLENGGLVPSSALQRFAEGSKSRNLCSSR